MEYPNRSNLVWHLEDYRKFAISVFTTSAAFLFIFLLLVGAFS